MVWRPQSTKIGLPEPPEEANLAHFVCTRGHLGPENSIFLHFSKIDLGGPYWFQTITKWSRTPKNLSLDPFFVKKTPQLDQGMAN